MIIVCLLQVEVTKIRRVRKYFFHPFSTGVYYRAEIDAIDTINDFNQQFSLMLLEYIRWEDPRLAFQDIDSRKLPSLKKAHIEYGIDMTSAAGVIWKPDFLYVDQVDEETYQE